VVELCDKHIRRNYKQRTQSSNVANRQRQSIRHQPRPPEGEHVTIPESTNDPLSDRSHASLEHVACSSSANVKPPKLLSIGRVIERRWHCLWLKSLEWQCFLEQLTWTPRLRKKPILEPRKSETSPPEGSTTTSVAVCSSSHGIPTNVSANEVNRCSTYENELQLIPNGNSHQSKLNG
jgi:hypothetical protein